MIAPAAFEDVTFPQQSLLDWSVYECNQWTRAGQSYFNSGSNFGNSVQYGSATLLHTGMGQINGGTLAPNGKLYLGAYGTTGAYTLNTYTDVTASLGNISNNCQTVFYSAFTNRAYLANDGLLKPVNTANDLTDSDINLTFGGQCMAYGTSYDGRYAYVNNFYVSKNINKVDLINASSVNAYSGSFTGDPLKGVIGIDGRMYMGCGGGGSNSIKVYDPATNTISNLSSGQQVNDSYRDLVQHWDGYIYSYPAYNSTQPIIRINPLAQTIENLTSISDPRTFSLCVGADGKIYGVGNGDAANYGVVIYDPVTNTSTTESLPSGKNWRLIKMGAQGDLYLFNTAGECYKKSIINNGGVLKPLAEFNGIVGRLQNT